jgi:hypothetical protein
MIEKFYASHIKNMIDASAVNVRRKRLNDRVPKREADAKRAKPSRKPVAQETRQEHLGGSV